MADYWDQYGFSHRPLVSRWFWVADYRWFAGSNHLLLSVSLLMQCAIALGVWRVVTRDQTLSGFQRLILMSGVFLCVFTVTQVFNLLHTFDVQWFLTAAAVVWSVDRLVAGMSNHDTRCLVVAWLFVLLASWNNFSGLVIWPVQLILLNAMGYRIAQQAGYLAATTLYLILYFYGLPTGSGALIQGILHDGGALALLKVLLDDGRCFFLSGICQIRFHSSLRQRARWRWSGRLTWFAHWRFCSGICGHWGVLMALSGRSWHPGGGFAVGSVWIWCCCGDFTGSWDFLG